MTLSLLDGSVAKLVDAIPKLSLGELESLRAAEEAGKTRKGALAALDEAIAACEPDEAPEPLVEGSEVASEPEEAPEDAPEEPGATNGAVEAPDEEEIPPGKRLLKNDKPGTTLHVGDGRRLAYGESVFI